MNEHTAISRFIGKSIFYYKPVIMVSRISNQVTAGIAHAYEQAVANEERIFC